MLRSNHRSPFPPFATVTVCDGSFHITVTTDDDGMLNEDEADAMLSRIVCRPKVCKGWHKVKARKK